MDAIHNDAGQRMGGHEFGNCLACALTRVNNVVNDDASFVNHIRLSTEGNPDSLVRPPLHASRNRNIQRFRNLEGSLVASAVQREDDYVLKREGFANVSTNHRSRTEFEGWYSEERSYAWAVRLHYVCPTNVRGA